MVGRARRQRVADAQHAAVLAASFHTCRGAHAAVPPGIARFSRCAAALLQTPESCLVADAGVRSALGDRSEECYEGTKSKINSQNPQSLFLSAELSFLNLRDVRQPKDGW